MHHSIRRKYVRRIAFCKIPKTACALQGEAFTLSFTSLSNQKTNVTASQECRRKEHGNFLRKIFFNFLELKGERQHQFMLTLVYDIQNTYALTIVASYFKLLKFVTEN